MTGELPPPGWYPDTERPGGERFWDGQVWTEHRRPAAAAATAPAASPGLPGGPVGPKPDPWLWQSIVATVLCCLPFGVAGIVFAAQSQSAWDAGRHAEAVEKAARAKKFTLISAVAAVALFAAWLLFILIVGVIGGAAGTVG